MRHRTLLCSVILLAACSVGTVGVRTLNAPPAGSTSSITTPVKAHLVDGSTVRFPNGVSLSDGVLVGTGQRVGLKLETMPPVMRMPLDSVVGMESYERIIDGGASFALTLLGLGATALVGAAAAVAVFGSCPTFFCICSSAS